MQLAVEAQAADDLGAVGLQAAVQVVEPEAREPAGDGVEDPRGDPAGERVAALRLPARDEVEALVELREQARDLGRVVLQVAVDRDDDVALRLLEAGLQRGRLAEVAPQPDDADVVVRGVEPRERGERAVGRAVVDEDASQGPLERLERGARARRRGARRCAPRRAPGRRPRSRPLAYAPDGRAADDRGGARARARARAAARRRGGRARGGGGPRAGRGRARAASTCRRFASSAMDGFARSRGRHARAAAGRRPDRRRAARADARSSPARRWGSPPAAPFRTAPTPSSRSSSLSNKTTTIEVAEPVEPGAHVRPVGGDVRAGDVVARRPARGSAPRRSARSPRPAWPRSPLRAAGRASPCSPPARELRAPGEPLGPGEIYESNGADARGRASRRRARSSSGSTPVADDEDGAPRGARARPRGGRARQLGRRLGRPARPRPARIGAELGVEEVFWGVAVQARASRSRSASRRDARLRPAREPGLVARRLRALRAAGAARAPGCAEPGPRYESGRLARAAAAERGARRARARAHGARRRTRRSLEPLDAARSRT